LKNYCLRAGQFLGSGDSYEAAKIVLVGVPLELTVTFRTGARGGPQAIRMASEGLEDFSPYLEGELGKCSFYDAGDLLLPFGNLQTSLERIETLTRKIIEDGKFPLFMGGEHLLSYAVVKAFAEVYPDLLVIHIDAHADLREDYLGEAFSHATVVRRICEIVGSNDVYQFAIRSGTSEEFAFARKFTNFYPFRLLDAFKECVPLFRDRPLYITFDIDVLDPAYAPGTGTPEPGGVTPQEVFQLFACFRGLRVVGFDLVEVAPSQDPSGITALLAAKIIREGIIAFS